MTTITIKNNDIKTHVLWNRDDFDYLKMSGYSTGEIKTMWDKELILKQIK